LVNNVVYDIAIDAAGDIWFATGGGMSRFDGTTWTLYTTVQGWRTTMSPPWPSMERGTSGLAPLVG